MKRHFSSWKLSDFPAPPGWYIYIEKTGDVYMLSYTLYLHNLYIDVCTYYSSLLCTGHAFCWYITCGGFAAEW